MRPEKQELREISGLRPRHPGPFSAQDAVQDAQDAMQGANDAAQDLSPSLAAALALPPALQIPADFAARVAQRVQAEAPRRRAVLPGWGARLAVASSLLLTAGMFALAPRVVPSLHNGWFDAELVLLAELGTLLCFSRHLFARD